MWEAGAVCHERKRLALGSRQMAGCGGREGKVAQGRSLWQIGASLPAIQQPHHSMQVPPAAGTCPVCDRNHPTATEWLVVAARAHQCHECTGRERPQQSGRWPGWQTPNSTRGSARGSCSREAWNAQVAARSCSGDPGTRCDKIGMHRLLIGTKRNSSQAGPDM